MTVAGARPHVKGKPRRGPAPDVGRGALLRAETVADETHPAGGCDRNIGSVKGSQFVCLPMGILGGGVTLQARRPVQFQVFNPLTGAADSNLTLKAGDRFALPQGPGAY
ncbi:MAG: hypothetical protein IMZ66_09410, partial [Planctomycetes bacterium]|nr:hypothetical protein [Planctomycetota bacterium]